MLSQVKDLESDSSSTDWNCNQTIDQRREDEINKVSVVSLANARSQPEETIKGKPRKNSFTKDLTWSTLLRQQRTHNDDQTAWHSCHRIDSVWLERLDRSYRSLRANQTTMNQESKITTEFDLNPIGIDQTWGWIGDDSRRIWRDDSRISKRCKMHGNPSERNRNQKSKQNTPVKESTS